MSLKVPTRQSNGSTASTKAVILVRFLRCKRQPYAYRILR